MSEPVSQDRHLNLFQLYRGSDVLENNLTRALAICLQQDALFLQHFIRQLLP